MKTTCQQILTQSKETFFVVKYQKKNIVVLFFYGCAPWSVLVNILKSLHRLRHQRLQKTLNFLDFSVWLNQEINSFMSEVELSSAVPRMFFWVALNKCLNLFRFPLDFFKLHSVQPLPKKSSKTIPSNYRPTSATSSINQLKHLKIFGDF